MADKNDPDVEVIYPPDTLRKKTEGGPTTVDSAALERAERAIASLADQYLPQVEQDLERLRTALAALKDNPADWLSHSAAVFQVAHDIKGQGGSFNYPLMTIIGNSLCRFIERAASGSPAVIQVIGLHADALTLVIAQRMTGDGGAAGARLLRGLELVAGKVADR